LKAGYNVVGSVRDSKKAHWMQSRFDKEYGSGRFELVTVSDLAADGAFDEAVRGTVRHSIPSAICADSLGVSGIAHVASIIGSVDPNEMIPTNVASAVNMLKAAAKEPSVKAVVYTSSSWACETPAPNVKHHVDQTLWNDKAVEAAWAPPPYTQERLMAVYAASKVEAEKACWKFMKDNKPAFVFNSGEDLPPIRARSY
jgi:nucleoside-diphosphate-sugar epimerase